MPELNRIAVIVLNWNGKDIVGGCLDSLLEQSYPNYQIVVVDNGSTDGSKELLEGYLAKHRGSVKLIFADKNHGFAGGVNIGIRYAMENGFWAAALLNNDAVAAKDWLGSLAKILREKDDVGIVTGLLLQSDGRTIDSTGDWYSIWGLPFPRGRDEPAATAAESGYVFGATGGASLYRLEMFKQIGLFDEKFFAYYEDVDISFRAQLASWKVYYSNQAIAYHKRGGTSNLMPGFTVYQTLKNLPILLVKNVPRGLLLGVGGRFLLIYPLVFLNRAKADFCAAARGVCAAVFYLPAAFKERVSIQRTAKVDSTYIRGILWPELPPTHRRLRRVKETIRRWKGR